MALVKKQFHERQINAIKGPVNIKRFFGNSELKWPLEAVKCLTTPEYSSQLATRFSKAQHTNATEHECYNIILVSMYARVLEKEYDCNVFRAASQPITDMTVKAASSTCNNNDDDDDDKNVSETTDHAKPPEKHFSPTVGETLYAMRMVFLAWSILDNNKEEMKRASKVVFDMLDPQPGRTSRATSSTNE